MLAAGGYPSLRGGAPSPRPLLSSTSLGRHSTHLPVPYCTHCGYNFAAHQPGSRCPECATIVSQPALSPPPNPLLATIALAATLLLPLLLFFRVREPALLLWIAAQLLHVVLSAAAYVQFRRSRPELSLLSLVLTTVAGALSLFFLTCLLAGLLRFKLWMSPVFALPVLFGIALSTLAMPPYHPRFIAAWALPLVSLIATSTAWIFTWSNIPDSP